MPHPTRRRFVSLAAAVAAALAPAPLRAMARRGGPHPEPRPGVDASRVLGPDALADADADARAAFDAARAVPQVLDGIRCQCGCAEREGFYSLLSCYEGEGMARHCMICQGEARLARRLHERGESLAAIRAAIDARFG